MKKTFFVLRHEVITILTSRSFLLVSIGIPLISILIFSVVSRLSGNSAAANMFTQVVAPPQEVQKAEGYVDLAGIIQVPPDPNTAKLLIAYPDEAAAGAALSAGKIAAYYIVPQDFLQKGTLTYIRPDFNPLSAMGKSSAFERLLRINLLGGNVALVDKLSMPLLVTPQSLSVAPQRDQGNALTFFIPYVITMIFYIVILGASSLLLSSVAKEKENRTIEILMAAITPRQLLAGKITGLGIVGLLQAALWVGTGYSLLGQSASLLNLSNAFKLPIGFLFWGMLFFILGYAVYASLMAGLGALVPNMREASQATMVVAMPLIVPLFLMNVLIESPNGSVSTILSLFPLTAPVVMMTRLSSGGVAWWQPPLAAVFLVITAVIVVRAVSSIFRAQTILSGQPFNVRRFLLALAGR